MPYKKGKFKCESCNADVSRKGVKLCRNCYYEKERPSRGNKDLQAQQRKEYKQQYFQKNKEKIIQKRKDNPINSDKQFLYFIKSKYSLSELEYKKMLEERNYCCDICGLRQIENPKNKDKLCIDHCHTTKKIRGLLCRNCNSAIGYFKDNVEIIKKSIKYLKKCQN